MRRFSGFLFYPVAVLISQSTAHFFLNYPPTIGFNDSLEGSAPCGSFPADISTDNVTDFHVAGDSVAVVRKPGEGMHPKCDDLLRHPSTLKQPGPSAQLLILHHQETGRLLSPPFFKLDLELTANEIWWFQLHEQAPRVVRRRVLALPSTTFKRL